MILVETNQEYYLYILNAYIKIIMQSTTCVPD